VVKELLVDYLNRLLLPTLFKQNVMTKHIIALEIGTLPVPLVAAQQILFGLAANSWRQVVKPRAC
jgi:hypothetical protein